MKKSLLLLTVCLFAFTASSQQVTINTNLNQDGVNMSNDLIGAFFEDINYGADGGLYAEMVQNRSFEYHIVSGYCNEGPLAHWNLISNDGLYADYEVVNNNPLNQVNTNYLKITLSSDGALSNSLRGKVGVGSWNTQAVFDDASVVSGDKVWINESFEDASNWNVREGTFSATNGTYIQSSAAEPAWCIANTLIDTINYTYTVKAKKTGGNEGFLFPFAYVDDNNYYWLNIGGWNNSQHAIEKCTDGIKSTVATIPGVINNDVWYTFTIEITEGICKFYMDNNLLFEMAAPTKVGLANHAGVANTGFFGMAVETGKKYKFSAYLKSESAYTGTAKVSLQDANGTIIATDSIEGITTAWKKYDLQLTPSATSTEASLSMLFDQTGIVYTDMVSLFPEETFMRRENGLRKDIAQVIADMEPKFLRFPGGCISHGRGLDNAYRWKETIGDVAERTPNWNLWGYHQTYGLGFFEYFQYSEDMGAKPLPVLPLGISCQFREREVVAVENLGPWIQDALDLIEFANGDASSEWGSKRAAMGHEASFNMEYLCLGNEEDYTDEFVTYFKMFQDSIKKYYPEIKVLGTSGTDDMGYHYDNLWQFSHEQNVAAVDEHYYNDPAWFLENNHRYDNFDRNGPKVFIGEYASRNDLFNNALAEAAYLTGVERNADVIQFTCYAPLLKNVGVNQWNPDLILFDNANVTKTVNYYVQQLYSVNAGDVYLNSDMVFDDYLSTSLRQYNGKVGVGSWDTQCDFDDLQVFSGDKSWLSEDFSSDASNWTVNAGSFSVVNGAYSQLGSETPAWSFANTLIDTTTFTITLKARKTGGAEGFLIPFGYQDENNYYMLNLGGWNNTDHAIEKCTDGVKTSLVTKPGEVQNNIWYSIKIEISNSLCKVYLDNELLFTTEPPAPVTCSVVKDTTENEMIIKIVNTSAESITANFTMPDIQFSAMANTMVLTSSSLTDRNSMDSPNTVAPVSGTTSVSEDFSYSLDPYSFHVIRFSMDNMVTPEVDEIVQVDRETSPVVVSPNPAKDYINVRFGNLPVRTIYVMDLSGREHRAIKPAYSDRAVIERGDLPAGTYIVKLMGDNFSKTEKVVIAD